MVVSVTGNALARERSWGRENRPREMLQRMRPGEHWREDMLDRIIKDPELVEEIGLTEEQIKAYRNKKYDLEAKSIRLRAELKLAGLEQARLMTDSAIDEAAVMKAVEKTGKSRTELAKLKVKKVLLVKQSFTPEQIKKAGQLMRRRRQEALELKRKGAGKVRQLKAQMGERSKRAEASARKKKSADDLEE